jgi:hypothetical protein
MQNDRKFIFYIDKILLHDIEVFVLCILSMRRMISPMFIQKQFRYIQWVDNCSHFLRCQKHRNSKDISISLL